MSDFFQNGVISVLHRLGSPNVEQLEAELEQYRSANPISRGRRSIPGDTRPGRGCLPVSLRCHSAPRAGR